MILPDTIFIYINGEIKEESCRNILRRVGVALVIFQETELSDFKAQFLKKFVP